MSSAPAIEPDLSRLREDLSQWLEAEVTGLERVGGGRNSQVYAVSFEPERRPSDVKLPFPKVEGRDGLGVARSAGAERRRYAVKIYFRHPTDSRDRLGTEYSSLRFLWEHGFRQVPEPLAADPNRGWAFYQFIQGDKILPGQATLPEVLTAADFLGRLRELSSRPESRNLGVASEAFFAPSLVIRHVRERFERLVANAKRAEASAEAERVGEFLTREFAPVFEAVARWSEGRCARAGQSFTQDLSWEERTLSPSDFGFHNALRQPDGRLIFLDFEYFGWDDPAKMLADFLLHPAMALSPEAKTSFVRALLRRFADMPGLRARLEVVYPLFGLKWCLIFLNEFLPEALARRRFAAATPADCAKLQREQLEKSGRMLEGIRREYQTFPYAS